MLLFRFALLLLGMADALRVGAAVSRRDALARAAASVPLALALPALAYDGNQDGKLVTDDGAAYKGTSLSGSPSGASSLRGRKGGEKSTARLAGTWKDPGHPGCVRKVQLAGNKAFIKGIDEDGKPWKAVGLISGNDVTIDFTAKGGPADVTATYVVGKGLVFPDGNVWSKI